MTIKGYIGFDAQQRLIVDSYNYVLLFKNSGDAFQSGAVTIKAVISARMPRKKKESKS